MPQVTLHGWLSNGIAVDIHLEDHHNFESAMEISNQWLAAGMLTAPPVLENSERELIVTVMRREKSDGTPIIDFYPEWGAASVDTPYGTYKYVHKYLNNDGDVDKFLNASGFNSLEDIPLYDGQAPLKRSIGKAHPKETRVPTPFIVARKEGKEKLDSEGKPYHPWDLVGYEVAPQQVARTAPESRQDAPNSSATGKTAQSDGQWTQNGGTVIKFLAFMQKDYGLSHGQVIEALRYFSFAELTNVDQYEGTKEQAIAACIAYACKYDPATIAAQDGIAPGMKQLAIEMIELHETPF